MTSIADLIAVGQEAGIFQFYLPFVLSYAIIYGILAKTNIFNNKNIHIIVAGVLSLFLIGFTPVGITLAQYFGALFSGTVLIVVTILGTMMILYMLGKMIGVEIPGKQATKWWGLLLLLIAVVLAAGVFIVSGGTAFFPGLTFPGITIPELPILVLPSIGLSSAHLALIALLVGTAIVIWFVSRGEKTQS